MSESNDKKIEELGSALTLLVEIEKKKQELNKKLQELLEEKVPAEKKVDNMIDNLINSIRSFKTAREVQIKLNEFIVVYQDKFETPELLNKVKDFEKTFVNIFLGEDKEIFFDYVRRESGIFIEQQKSSSSSSPATNSKVTNTLLETPKIVEKGPKRSLSENAERTDRSSKVIKVNSEDDSEESSDEESVHSKPVLKRGHDLTPNTMLKSNEYFRQHVALHIALHYLKGRHINHIIKAEYPFVYGLEVPEGKTRGNGEGLGGLSKLIGQFIGHVVDTILLEEVDIDRADFDKLIPNYATNWMKARDKFPSTGKDLYSQSSAYQVLCKSTAESMTSDMSTKMFDKIDNFTLNDIVLMKPTHEILKLSQEQLESIRSAKKFKTLLNYIKENV